MLEYGFASEDSTAEVREKTEVWYGELTAVEKALFHQQIPFVLMSTGIGQISSVSSVHIAQRLSVNDAKWLGEFCGYLNLDKSDAVNAFATWLSRRLGGYRSNCGYDTNAAWVRRYTRNLPKADLAAPDDVIRFKARAGYLPPVGPREIKEMYAIFTTERAARLDATRVEVRVEVAV